MLRLPVALFFLLAPAAALAATSGPVRLPTPSYPPSCLSAPLTDTPTGPVYTQSATLPSIDRDTSEYHGTERVDYTFWRVACDGGKSALLLRIARAPDAVVTRAAQLPFSYGLGATQGDVSGTVRLALEPDTLTASLVPGALILSAVTVVLENAPTDDAYKLILVPMALPPGVRARTFDFNQAIDIGIFDAHSSTMTPPPPPLVVHIPAYDPSQYPAARGPMAVSGYLAGNYFDPAHNGEGMVIDVSDTNSPAVPRPRTLAVSWYTYDANARPFWIFGSAQFVPGETTVTVPMLYLANGGFAGSFGASASSLAWGNVSVSFPDCLTLHFSYASQPGLPAPVPSGAGERTWTRLTIENGLACR
ncbi:MAG: hypothetical protein ACXWBQ_09910 [Usitatibacter sp.]